MRPTISALALACCFLFASAAKADPTYSLNFTQTGGNYNGSVTGSFTINSQPLASGASDYMEYGGSLEDLTFTIDGDTFTLATDGTHNAIVDFSNGLLSSITYDGAEGNGDQTTFTVSGSQIDYSFVTGHGENQQTQSGTISLGGETGVDPSPTPEPSSLVLVGTGLLGVGAMLRRRAKVS